jgi:D-alanine-D-alanine ligase-like ATP-grasp enzyme
MVSFRSIRDGGLEIGEEKKKQERIKRKEKSVKTSGKHCSLPDRVEDKIEDSLVCISI